METSDWLDPFVESSVKAGLEQPLDRDFGKGRQREIEIAKELRADPAHCAKDAEEVMARNIIGYLALPVIPTE